MVICAIIGCGNRSKRDKNKSFFRLPSVLTNQGSETESLSKKRQDAWLARIKREDISPEQYYNVRVCSDHFISGVPAKLYNADSPDWTPSLNLGYKEIDKRSLEKTTERYERAAKRRRLRMDAMIVESFDLGCNEQIDELYPEETDESVVTHSSVQTEISFDLVEEHFDSIKKLKSENEQLKKENEAMKQTISKLHWKEESFKDNDKKVVFYTGLCTWGLLMTLFTYIKPHLHVGGNGTLTPFQRLLITLIRLRLNLQIQDLGYRFNVHNSTISRVFLRLIDVLHTKLKPLPDRNSLKKTMPISFRKHFPSCVVIIDCFEIFLDRPTSLLARAQTYSSYKHHNTVKYLIGITPQGTVNNQ